MKEYKEEEPAKLKNTVGSPVNRRMFGAMLAAAALPLTRAKAQSGKEEEKEQGQNQLQGPAENPNWAEDAFEYFMSFFDGSHPELNQRNNYVIELRTSEGIVRLCVIKRSQVQLDFTGEGFILSLNREEDGSVFVDGQGGDNERIGQVISDALQKAPDYAPTQSYSPSINNLLSLSCDHEFTS